MLLVEIPWAAAIWALPFLTVLSPSERYYQGLGREGQKLTERAWQIIQLVMRWLPDRTLVFVADSSFAALTLLKLVSGMPTVSLITRLRLDAALYDPAPPRQPHQRGPHAAQRQPASNPGASPGKPKDEVDEAGDRGLVRRGKTRS